MAPIDNTGPTAITVVGPVYSILAAILARGLFFLKKIYTIPSLCCIKILGERMNLFPEEGVK